MNKFKKLFKSSCSIIGMVHVNALPGTPLYQGSIQKIIDAACKDTEVYLQNDIDALLIENMHDVPYLRPKNIKPEIIAMMTRICTEIRKLTPKNVPCGVQVLAGCNQEAIAIAQSTTLDFIRAEGFVFGHMADEGFIDACAGELLRYRKQIDAEKILIFTDVKKKHSSHSITSDVSLAETAKAADFFLSDGIILTGTSTGVPANLDELSELKSNTKLPVLIGSGITLENFEEYLKADAFIIGSNFKTHGDWRNEVNENRVKKFMKTVKNEREKNEL